MRKQFNSLLLVLLLFSVSKLVAQEQKPPFWYDVQAFKKMDSIQMPAQNQVLFIGSSSFTKWKTVQADFPGHQIINRAFGGSSFPDLIRFADDIIFPYHPKQVVIYCGDNDLAGDDKVTPAIVLERFQTLFGMIRKQLPGTSIVFVSIKPSPSRRHLMPKMLEANLAIKNFLKKKKRTAFVDVYHKMLTPEGEPMPDIFLEDKLHMTEKGYVIWQQLIEPHLMK